MFCVAAAHKARQVGRGRGRGNARAGSEREKGAAEGGWGLRGCSLGPLHWITAGDPFLSPEYVQSMERAEATKGKESRGRNEFWGGTEESLQWGVPDQKVECKFQANEQQQLFYEKYRPGGSGRNSNYELPKTTKGAAGEGERMWREKESIDGNVTCAEAPKTGRAGLHACTA
ncbi:hypothetical protein B0H14DRAFT_2601799 [Mycena olivaceomarginata]|nr:hypothetical protein B0H14DRAFT_2601799 [Mycena olivaceomarginata]